jgi:hypothetical protein
MFALYLPGVFYDTHGTVVILYFARVFDTHGTVYKPRHKKKALHYCKAFSTMDLATMVAIPSTSHRYQPSGAGQMTM